MVKPSTSSSSSLSPPDLISSEPKYKGVRKRKWGKYVSEIRLPNSRERIWLGSYDTAEKAARAFDAALYCLRGSNAKFNFPNNPPENIDGGRSLSPLEIQRVASRFANENPNPSPNPDSVTTLNCTGGESSVDSDTAIDWSHSSQAAPIPNPNMQMDVDWSFLNLLDNTSSEGVSKFGFYSGLDNMGNDYFMPPLNDDNNDDRNNENDDHNGDESNYSQQSSLWNFW